VGLTFRPVDAGDAPLLARLTEARWGWLPDPRLAELQERAQRQAYVARYGADGEHVVLLDDVPVGRVWWCDDPADRWIVDAVLLPEARSRGLGTKVFATLVASAGDRTVRCSVERTKPRWQHALERLGFTEVSHDDVYAQIVRPPGPLP